MIADLYLLILRIPEKVFLIPYYKNAKFYFGSKSYRYYLKDSNSRSEYGYNSKIITIWRTLVHIIASLFFFFILSRFSSFYFNSYSLLLFTYIIYQEFFLQVRQFNQPYWKSVLDTFAWVLPIFLFL
jgi:hypothetical protein